METTLENLNPDEIQTGGRPKFLKNLCILSFIWCGVVLFFSVWGMIMNTPENMAERIEQIRPMNPKMADQMEEQMIGMQEDTYMQISPYLGIVYLLGSFLGVLMMWKLNKKGYYLYLASEILPYTGFLFMMGDGPSFNIGFGGESMKVVGIIFGILAVLIDVGFMVMYGMQVKHMTAKAE